MSLMGIATSMIAQVDFNDGADNFQDLGVALLIGFVAFIIIKRMGTDNERGAYSIIGVAIVAVMFLTDSGRALMIAVLEGFIKFLSGFTG